ncbi:MAG: TIM barrel protein [Stappiaceae bacterium]
MTEAAVPLEFALNHMSVPGMTWRELVHLARQVGCSGIELRSDLEEPLFGSDSPENVGNIADRENLRIHALAEVPRFNDATSEVLISTTALAEKAQRSGTSSIVLIPRIGGEPATDDTLCQALDKIGTILETAGIRGLIEPIGFANSSLRDFDQARRAIDATHGYGRFGLVHDTFHHFLIGSGAASAQYVDVVHVSGVTVDKPNNEITDADRVFVDAADCLGTVDQLAELVRDGYRGPVSMEAFSPQVHSLPDPAPTLRTSFDHIRSSLMPLAA